MGLGVMRRFRRNLHAPRRSQLGNFAAENIPLSVAGMTHWFDATKIPYAADGTVIKSWPDLSGNSRDAANVNSTAVLRTDRRNGLPVVIWNGGQGLVTPSNATLFAQPSTLFVVAKRSASGLVVFVDGLTGSERNGFFYDTAQPGPYIYAGTVKVGGTMAIEQFVVCSALFKGASSMIWMNKAATGAASNAGTQGYRGLILGNTYTQGYPLFGAIAEVIAFNAELAQADRELIENYLIAKWGMV